MAAPVQNKYFFRPLLPLPPHFDLVDLRVRMTATTAPTVRTTGGRNDDDVASYYHVIVTGTICRPQANSTNPCIHSRRRIRTIMHEGSHPPIYPTSNMHPQINA
eukprot:GHVU01196222.1.p2 GENE.GHVU01196222.1~~GHVU01196222.1.p2  ORF type:complete len:104 (-),score=4.57 GHVU01196222.1:773-1084(-)